ncbi:MAG: hypothetical protein KAS87_05480 [Candidatus Omnitrophica bacterium]|nr:hypothetical protein [Candidatus Omnitrophota bacterium]
MSTIRDTLTELITKNFVNIKGGKKTKRKAQNPKFSISAILINSAVREVKEQGRDTLKEENLEETTEEQEDKNKVIVNGGYGTINKHYGISPVVNYTDYSKIWDHLGSFRTKGAYENAESSNEIAVKNGESTREMVSSEILDKAAKHFKYFVRGELMGEVGLVPPVGLNINSKDWEKYRLMSLMSIYQPLIKLMRSMA